jgi:hypothetical protein
MSWSDLRALAKNYKKGRIDVGNFSYGVVSEWGSLSLVITNQSLFSAFANKLDANSSELIKVFKKMAHSKHGQHGVGGPIGKFIKFLNEQNSGLSAVFRPYEMVDYSTEERDWTGNWRPIDSQPYGEYQTIVNADCD